jgi:hypothetical protein
MKLLEDTQTPKNLAPLAAALFACALVLFPTAAALQISLPTHHLRLNTIQRLQLKVYFLIN